MGYEPYHAFLESTGRAKSPAARANFVGLACSAEAQGPLLSTTCSPRRHVRNNLAWCQMCSPTWPSLVHVCEGGLLTPVRHPHAVPARWGIRRMQDLLVQGLSRPNVGITATSEIASQPSVGVKATREVANGAIAQRSSRCADRSSKHRKLPAAARTTGIGRLPPTPHVGAGGVRRARHRVHMEAAGAVTAMRSSHTPV